MPEPWLEEAPPYFAGKVLWIIPARAVPQDQSGFVLEFATIEERLGKLFLVGRQAVLQNGEWVAHREVSLSWSAVVEYTVFESREDYIRRSAAHYGGHWKVLASRSA